MDRVATRPAEPQDPRCSGPTEHGRARPNLLDITFSQIHTVKFHILLLLLAFFPSSSVGLTEFRNLKMGVAPLDKGFVRVLRFWIRQLVSLNAPRKQP